MNKSKLLSISLFIAIPFLCLAQVDNSKITVEKKNYSFENEKYKSFRSLEPVFKLSNNAYEQFQGAQKAQMSAYVWGGISLLSVSSSVLVVLTTPGSNTNSENFGRALGSFGLATLGSITGIIGIVQQLRTNKKKKNTINAFNQRSFGFDDFQKPDEYYTISVTPTGIYMSF